MRNIALLIEYDGTNYYGWQKQPGYKTIQGILERTIEKIVQEKISLIASGRTDRGVHARGQVANFKINKEIKLESLKKGLNALLPYDIRIKKIYEVPLSFHARFSAKRKVYYYYFSHFSHYTTMFRNYIWYIPHDFDIKVMREVARSFLGTHDFSSFKNLRGKWEKDTDAVRTIFYSDIIPIKGGIYIYRVCGDGFFYKMVRNMFGLMAYVGERKLNIDEAREILSMKNRAFAPPPAPPQGLFLIRVIY